MDMMSKKRELGNVGKCILQCENPKVLEPSLILLDLFYTRVTVYDHVFMAQGLITPSSNTYELEFTEFILHLLGCGLFQTFVASPFSRWWTRIEIHGDELFHTKNVHHSEDNLLAQSNTIIKTSLDVGFDELF